MGNFNFCTFTQICNGLTGWSFEIPTSAYCQPLSNLTKPTMTNIPISKFDPFTKKFNLEWESLGGNKFYEKVLNGTINMVSTKPDINRLFLTANHLDGKDYLILRHPSKDFRLDIGDKFYVLFENNDVLEFNIEKKIFSSL